MSARRRVAVYGYGRLGRFLCRRLLEDGAVPLELAFVHNRTALDGASLPVPVYTGDAAQALDDFSSRHAPPDLIAEVAHPQIIRRHGEHFLACADLFVGSVTALADPDCAARLTGTTAHGLYLPAGAAWGVADVARMDRAGSLRGLTVTMRFHPDALRLHGEAAQRLTDYLDDPAARGPCTLFDGRVADLAPQAPNNVNTMTCLALAAASLGVAGTRAVLIADRGAHAHVVEIEVEGPDGFAVTTRRVNPARPGAVTGDQTYHAFWQSLLAAHGRGAGVHFC